MEDIYSYIADTECRPTLNTEPNKRAACTLPRMVLYAHAKFLDIQVLEGLLFLLAYLFQTVVGVNVVHPLQVVRIQYQR